VKAFVDALDTLNVVVFVNNTEIGKIFMDSIHRQMIESFSRSKGIVSIHLTTDSRGSWLAWDSLQGARVQNHPPSERYATIRLDTLSGKDASWHFLNRGLADTTLHDLWLSFTTNADVIRATPGLKTTINIDESSYAGGLGGARAMGADHPMSWYREFPEGGRSFYTAIGYSANLYQGGAQSRFLRRQLYNAILWAAGVDSTGAVSIRGINPEQASRFADAARVAFAGSTLAVSILKDGPHAIEIRGLDGRQVAARRGEGRAVHEFAGLRPGAVYAVSVTTESGQKLARLVTTP
jgi:type 1 glutamine amidotransferase